jgi:anti-sigma factor RsiW
MTTHVEDGALVRYLDREDTVGERTDVASHLEGCDRCAARMAELTRAADTLATALRAADAPPARARPRPRWGLRAAAAVLVLAGVGGAVRPVRAWILERAAALWVAVTGRDGATPVPGQPVPARSASVAFVPEGNEFALEVTARQEGGVLRIETADGDTAVAIVRGGSGAEDLVVLPRALRIVTRGASSASYVVRVPARLVRVRVVVGGGTPWDYHPGAPPMEIELGSR